MIMRTGNKKSKLGRPLREWEVEDSSGLHDEMRARFGDRWYVQEYLCMGVFSDVLGGAKANTTGRTIDDPDFERQYPTLYLLMAHTVDDEGKPRIPATLTVVCEDGQAKVGLNERNHMVSLWTGAGSLGGAFAALEGALSERPVQWRKVTWKGKK
jgi:hypothetical protein